MHPAHFEHCDHSRPENILPGSSAELEVPGPSLTVLLRSHFFLWDLTCDESLRSDGLRRRWVCGCGLLQDRWRVLVWVMHSGRARSCSQHTPCLTEDGQPLRHRVMHLEHVALKRCHRRAERAFPSRPGSDKHDWQSDPTTQSPTKRPHVHRKVAGVPRRRNRKQDWGRRALSLQQR